MTGDKIAFIHTVASLVAPFEKLTRERSSADTLHTVDTRLFKTGSGVPSLAMDASVGALRRHVHAARDAGAGAVVVTCSNLGPATDVVSATETIPVVRINRPLARQAIEHGGRIAVLVTDEASLPATQNLLETEAEEQSATVELSFSLVEGAIDAMLQGETEKHDRLIRERIIDIQDNHDVVVLAQASMASAVNGFSPAVKVLTSPSAAVDTAAGLLTRTNDPASPPVRKAPPQVSQLRIYRIRDGLMADWIPFFFETLVPLHTLVGIPVPSAFINPSDPNEFVWIRQFDTVDSVESQEAEFFGTPARVALGDVRGRWVESLEVRILTPARPADAPELASNPHPTTP